RRSWWRQRLGTPGSAEGGRPRTAPPSPAVLTVHSVYTKRSARRDRSHGSRDGLVRGRHGRGGRDVGHPEPAPRPRLRVPLPPARAPLARRHRRRASAEQEPRLGQHAGPDRVAPRAPHPRPRLAQGPLRGRHELLAGAPGGHGAALPLDGPPGAGDARRHREGPRARGRTRTRRLRHGTPGGPAGPLRGRRRRHRGLQPGPAARSRDAEERRRADAEGGPPPALKGGPMLSTTAPGLVALSIGRATIGLGLLHVLVTPAYVPA